MNDKTLNIILFGVIIYLLLKQKNNKLTQEQKDKYAEAVGSPKAIGDLGTTF